MTRRTASPIPTFDPIDDDPGSSLVASPALREVARRCFVRCIRTDAPGLADALDSPGGRRLSVETLHAIATDLERTRQE